MSETNPMSAMRQPFATLVPAHFSWSTTHEGRVAVLTLTRPTRKNPLTFDSYA